ncbi:hypothetical protein C9374_007518 [Naegleria lovaniensis]|uniref:Profilin n=1 Tax=Naegleria lovaniensis TaxID=51637 RepID=A0AA88KLW8_NAELO|nr:uncharacterized protein C9374_007518 [Naegleria lovaniensis]KAG2379379.1 hypothetical protein C9374_007518 [Naegleria lovaniensis]
MATLPWTQWVQGALLAPSASSGVEAVLLIGKDGSMWGLAGNWNVSPTEAQSLAALLKGWTEQSPPISPTLAGSKFMGIRCDGTEFVCNGPNKTAAVGIVCSKTIVIAMGKLEQARNISAGIGKAISPVNEYL